MVSTTMTLQQEQAIMSLEKQGFRFSNWIATNPDAENEEQAGERQTAVMKRKPNRYTTEYREVAPDGTIN